MTESIMQEEQQSLSLRDIYFVIFRHKKKALIFAAAVITAATIYAFLFTNNYYISEAHLMVRIGRESLAVDRTAAPGEIIRINRSRNEEIKTEIEIIKSRETAEKVLRSMGLKEFINRSQKVPDINNSPVYKLRRKLLGYIKSAALELRKIYDSEIQPQPVTDEQLYSKAVDIISGSLEVKRIRDTSIINVSYTALNPDFAHDVLDKIIESYMGQHIKLLFTESSYNFLKNQTQKIRSELEQTDQRIIELKNKTGIASIDDQLTIERINSIQQAINEIESNIAASSAKIKLFKKNITNLQTFSDNEGTAGLLNSTADEMRIRLNELRNQELVLLETYTEQSNPVQEVRRQIRQIQNMISSLEQSPQAVHMPFELTQQLRTELMLEEGNLSSLKAKLKVMKDQVRSEIKKLRKVNKNLSLLKQLQRKWAADETSYSKFSSSFEQARIDKALKLDKVSNISISQPPTFPVKPIDSKNKLILLAGLLVGIFGAIGLTFLIDKMDHTIKKPDDIKTNINLPNLVSIPHLDKNEALLPDIAAFKNLRMIPKPSDSTLKNTYSKQANNLETRKYFEPLMHRILFSDKNDSVIPQVIGITSCRHGEGVTTVAVNLAVNLARLDKGRVLLMDMNLFKLDKKESIDDPYPNLGNILALRKGSTTDILGPKLDQLYMLQSSKFSKSTGLDDLQNLYKSEYDFVVMDMPAIFEDNSIDIIARLADKVVLVIQAEKERWQVINHARELLQEANVNLVGTVLNKRNYYIPAWLYKRL